MLPLFDIHAHLADRRLQNPSQLVAEAQKRGVRGILATAAEHSDWEKLLALPLPEMVPLAMGIHPQAVRSDWDAETASRLRACIRDNPRIRAVGEIGFDFWQGRETEQKQLEAFSAQLEIAGDAKLPAIFHNRKSWNLFFSELRNSKKEIRGVCHNFCGSREIARQALDAGLHLSFAGPLTNPAARRLREAALFTPNDRLLVESDSPDLLPSNHCGKLSYPWHVKEVLQTLATLRTKPIYELAEKIAENYQNLLNEQENRGKGTSTIR